MNTYIVRWYVNGTADVALVSADNLNLARRLAEVRLASLGIEPDRGKVRIAAWDPGGRLEFHLLSHGGRV